MNINDGVSSNIMILDGRSWDKCSVFMNSLFGAQDVLEIVRKGSKELG